jgi:spore coat polysaccharide biosynthesis protein SpsF
MKVLAVIQTRMDSKRLPFKAVREIEGRTMFERVVDRVMLSKKIDDFIIATTTNKNDGKIVELCDKNGWEYHRGITGEVLGQFCSIIMLNNADAIVRITGDCPLIDPQIMDDVIGKYLSLLPNISYVSNVVERTYPRGLDVEIISRDALNKSLLVANSQPDREHVTLYVRQHPEEFKVANVTNEKDYSNMRWCVDDQQDLDFIRKVYHYFKSEQFGWKDAIALLEKNLDWVIKDNQVDPKGG